MKRVTLKELNIKYKEYLKKPIIGSKNRFGWYSAILKNGELVVGSSYAELELSILSRIQK